VLSGRLPAGLEVFIGGDIMGERGRDVSRWVARNLRATEQIEQLDDETGARARSAMSGHTACFADSYGLSHAINRLMSFPSGRVKCSG